MITGQLRVIAGSRDEAEELAGYLNRLSGGKAVFWRAKRGQEGEWVCNGEIEMPDGQDTRTWHREQTSSE